MVDQSGRPWRIGRVGQNATLTSYLTTPIMSPMNANNTLAWATALVTLACMATLNGGCDIDPCELAPETISGTGDTGGETGGDTGPTDLPQPQPFTTEPCTSLVDACCFCPGGAGEAPVCAAWGEVNASGCDDLGGEYVQSCVIVTLPDSIDGPVCFTYSCV